MTLMISVGSSETFFFCEGIFYDTKLSHESAEVGYCFPAVMLFLRASGRGLLVSASLLSVDIVSILLVVFNGFYYHGHNCQTL